LVDLYDRVREWDYLEQIKDFDSQEMLSIDLSSFIDKLHEDWKYIEKKDEVFIKVHSTITNQWVETDLLRLKFLFKYFINECCKYMAKGEQITINFEISDSSLVVAVNSESKLLQTYWRENSLYSPYYRAFHILLQDLKGELIDEATDHFKVYIRIPIKLINEDHLEPLVQDLEVFMEQIKILPKDKSNLLVYSINNDHLLVQQLLGDDSNSHLVYNTKVNEVISNIEHYRFDALILYNIPSSDSLRMLFKQIQKKVQKQRLLIFYIAEEVDYFMQEQLVQLGVTDFIHLPLNKKLIENKIHKRIRYDKENKEANSFSWNADSLEEGDRIESSNERMLRKAMDLMTTNLGTTDFGVEQLSQMLGVSKMKCYRLFKELLNLSPSEVLTQLRLKKAESLLQQGNLTIAEISFECGFNDPKYFSKTFKKHFNSSPSSFKKGQ